MNKRYPWERTRGLRYYSCNTFSVTDSIESFLAQSASSGYLDSQGQFTIDLENARRKTIEYGLDRPDKGLLKLVQAAVQGGAAELTVKVLQDELRLDISGSPELEKQAEEEMIQGKI